VILLALPLSSLTQAQSAVGQDFDRKALDRIVSGQGDAERGEQRREALIGRQRSLLNYLPWRSGIGPGSYYWGAPYAGPPYPGITASYSAGAFYGSAYGVTTNSTVLRGQGALLDLENRQASAAPKHIEADGFTAHPNRRLAPPVLSTALYGPYGIGGVGIAGGVNPLFAGLPGWLNAFEPTPFIPGYIYGYPYVGAVEQPVGHRILSAGAKGYIYEPVYANDAARSSEVVPVAPVVPPSANAPINTESQTTGRLTAGGRRMLGDAVEAFQRQSYGRAIKSLDSLKLETDPHFPAELLLAQTLFALGKYDDADAALHRALEGLPESEWGLIVENYLDYYLLPKPFEWQLRALEKYLSEHPDAAPAACLLGFEYGYLGYPVEAAEYLQRANAIAPGDRIANRLHQHFSGLAAQQRAASGEPPLPVRAPKVPKPEGVDENVEEGAREF
jgi:tetratricopeptide (TPR) repeat protein